MKISIPEKYGFSSERLNRISPVMQAYVEERKLPGIITLVARKGEVVHINKFGCQDVNKNKPIEFDTIFRIYSMTKPITSVALMMLYEKGLFHLSDPVSKYLPEFENVKVYEEGGKLVDPVCEITIHHLLTHTAGLSYGIFGESPIDKRYIEADLWEAGIDLQEMVRRIASLPLKFHPGQKWCYSVATSVVGRLIELISDIPLDDYFEEKIFKPLGMVDTAFSVPKDKVDRFASLYGQTETSQLDEIELEDFFNVTLYYGGGGLVSTAEDYLQFAKMLLNKGELGSVRLLGRKTLELMCINHLPDSFLPLVIEETYPGIGFGLGFSVLVDIAQAEIMGSLGTYSWGGMASTNFWIDPVEEIIGIILTQYVPTNVYPLNADFRSLVYQAIID
jgi:CubicO group peptidase (beta-lactamase class C family)